MVTERESKLWLLYSKKHKNISMTASPLRSPPEPLACQVLCQSLGNQRWMQLDVCLQSTQSPGQRGSQSEDGGGPTRGCFRKFYVWICLCKGVGERIPMARFIFICVWPIWMTLKKITKSQFLKYACAVLCSLRYHFTIIPEWTSILQSSGLRRKVVSTRNSPSTPTVKRFPLSNVSEDGSRTNPGTAGFSRSVLKGVLQAGLAVIRSQAIHS